MTLPTRQRGASLLAALLLVMILLLLGITAFGAALTRFRLAANQQYDNDAFNQAERALGVAEQWLAREGHFRDPGFEADSPLTSPGLYAAGSRAAAIASPPSVEFTASNAVCVDGNTACNSSYVIGLLARRQRLAGSGEAVGASASSASSACDEVDLFQVIARGRAGHGASKTLATVFSVLSCNAL